MMDVNTGFFAGVCFGKAKPTLYPICKMQLGTEFLKATTAFHFFMQLQARWVATL